MKKIAIIGVGLIGASLGKALLKKGVVESVSGFGRRRANLETALENRCITHIAQTLEEAVRDAEVVVVCTPVETIAKTIREAAPFVEPGTVFTDVGSTKASIFDDFHEICEEFGCVFIGGHPIAGKEVSGAVSADDQLYVGKTVVLTNRVPEEAFQKVEALWRSVGANVVFMSALEHDAVLARTSHLPHLLACVLSSVTEPELFPFTGTGYESMTRLASGSPEVWRDIFSDNRPNLISALEDYLEKLAELRKIIESGDKNLLEEFLGAAKSNRDLLLSRKAGQARVD